jgi:hypothetical protein
LPRITFEPQAELTSAADEHFDRAVERALANFKDEPGQALKAATLLMRWMEQDRAKFAPVISRLIREHIARKITDLGENRK